MKAPLTEEERSVISELKRAEDGIRAIRKGLTKQWTPKDVLARLLPSCAAIILDASERLKTETPR